MRDLESLTKIIEDNFKLLDTNRSAYNAKCTHLKNEIVKKALATDDQIRKRTLEMYKIIHEQQLHLLDETDKHETELTRRLEQICAKHQETEEKIKKYDYIFKNVLLDEENMNKMKLKVNELNTKLNAHLSQLESFTVDTYIFKSGDLIEENLSIGDFYVYILLQTFYSLCLSNIIVYVMGSVLNS